MSTRKQKLVDKKKKEKELRSKTRVLARRDFVQKEKEKDQKEQAIMKSINKQKPFLKNDEAIARREAWAARSVSDKLKKNLQILENLF